MRLLLFSNSTNAGEPWFQFPFPHIREFLDGKPLNCLFIPYAAVTFSFGEYTQLVRQQFNAMGHNVMSLEEVNNPLKAIANTEAIIVGGGNTFHLLNHLQKRQFLAPIREKVLSGTPYIGWSAGSNLSCPTISTTNDMPIVQVENFQALNLVPFQINPHYLDTNPEGHAGETRETRILEFIEVNPSIYVLGLREGSFLLLENKKLMLHGTRSARLYKKGTAVEELKSDSDLSFLLH
jgi:dipeptidase E